MVFHIKRCSFYVLKMIILVDGSMPQGFVTTWRHFIDMFMGGQYLIMRSLMLEYVG